MIYLFFILLIIITPFVFALTQRDFLRNLKNTANGEYNRGWHDFQWLTMAMVLILGYIITFIPWFFYPFALFLTWTLSDGYQNKLKGNSFWLVNKDSKDVFMPVSMWYVKIPLLIFSALLTIIFSNYFGNIL